MLDRNIYLRLPNLSNLDIFFKSINDIKFVISTNEVALDWSWTKNS